MNNKIWSMNLLRALGQFTPFISPSLEAFEKKAATSTLLGRLPYLSFFENWFKYPFLLVGRLIVALIVTFILAGLTISPTYQDFVQERVIDAWLPTLDVEVEQNWSLDNFIGDLSNNITSTTQSLFSAVEREVYRNALYQMLAGEAFVIFRGIFIFLLYNILFWLFGNDVGSLEKRALRNQANLGNVSKALLARIQNQADYLFSQQQLSPQAYQQIQQIISKVLGGKGALDGPEVDYLFTFSWGRSANATSNYRNPSNYPDSANM